MKILRNSLFNFFIVFHFCLASFALQMENIVQKITQPIFVTSSPKTKNRKWNEKNIQILLLQII